MLTITLDEKRQKEIDREDHRKACTINFAEACATNNERFLKEADAIPEPEAKPDHKAKIRSRADVLTTAIQEKYDAANSRWHAAWQIMQYARLQATKIGRDPENVILRKTESEHSWEVVWEEGPFEWAISLTGGSNIYGSELGYGPGTEGDFDTYGPRAIAVKNQSAYARGLDYDRVPASDAAPLFERFLAPPATRDRKRPSPSTLPPGIGPPSLENYISWAK